MGRLSERYAAALFELTTESGEVEPYLQQAIYVRDVLRTPKTGDFLRHPHIPDAAKNQLFEELFAKKIAPQFMGFLHLAVAKSREELIDPTLELFIDKANHHLGRVRASVVSAQALTEKQLERLRLLLCKKLNKQVKIEHSVNPDVIGGFYVYADGRLIDCTVRTQLKKLRQTMERGVAE